MSHTPVLFQKALEYLAPKPGTFVIDGTLNGGGHAQGILERIAPDGILLGVDLDPEMTERFAVRHGTAPVRIIVRTGNYADMSEMLAQEELPLADGLLLDLGFSSTQLESSGRGFSFLRDEPLHMTYSPDTRPVKDILRRMSERELASTLRELGGERYAGRIARAITTSGRRKPISTSKELADIVRETVPRGYERGRIDPATRTFQALRILANDELGSIERVCADIPRIVAPRGRVVIMTFHSLEDRIVKQVFRAGARDGQYALLTKKPETASTDEVRENPRSRGAKLRAIELLSTNPEPRTSNTVRI